MAIPIVMPKLGLTMETGKIISWLKKEGDRVEKGETLLEIETDKLTNDVESPESGTLLKILIPGDTEDVKVQTLIGVLGEPGEDISPFLSDTNESEKISTPQAQMQPAEQAVPPVSKERRVKVRISPRAKRLIAAKGLDASVFENLGKSRITEDDVKKYLESQRGKEDDSGTSKTPLKGMRKRIAEKLSASKREIPHVYFRIVVDATKMIALRNSVKNKEERPSFNDIMIKAVASAISAFPQMNVSLVEDEIISHMHINIGLAVSLEDGLIVPMVKDADRKSLEQIQLTTKDLIQRARSNKLSTDDITGGTFTITNLGMYQVDEFTPIINPPESGILGVGRIAERVWAENGKIGIRPEMILTLSVDHRVIDGALAAQFLERVKQLLESLESL